MCLSVCFLSLSLSALREGGALEFHEEPLFEFCFVVFASERRQNIGAGLYQDFNHFQCTLSEKTMLNDSVKLCILLVVMGST